MENMEEDRKGDKDFLRKWLEIERNNPEMPEDWVPEELTITVKNIGHELSCKIGHGDLSKLEMCVNAMRAAIWQASYWHEEDGSPTFDTIPKPEK